MIKNITALLLSCCIVPAFAQTSPLVQTDTLIVGYDIETALPVSSYSATGVGAAAFDNAAHIDVAKALYGKIAGLNVRQGVGSSADTPCDSSVPAKPQPALADALPRDLLQLPP